MRRVMSLVYRHSQRYGLIPRKSGVEPDALRPLQDYQYEAMILTPEQA
jgi:hypothetical protein